MYNNPDLHMHSIYSDGSDTPATLLEKIRNTNVDVFSLTDHDTYDGCFEIEKMLKPGDPKFIKGIEISCEDNKKYHILGYGFNTNKDSIRRAVSITTNARREKTINRLKFIKEAYGFEFTQEDVKGLLANQNPGRPHFVNLLLKYKYITTMEEGFSLVGKYRGEEAKLSPEEAVDAILSAGGIPVLAHGIKGEGSKNYSEEVIEEIVKRLKDCGLMGLECFYSTFTPEQKDIMLNLSKKYNLLITAGSDYHGTNKPIVIGQTNNPIQQSMQRFYRTIEMMSEE